jgi:hypothetical protein
MLILSKPSQIHVIIIWTLKFLSLGISAWPFYIWDQEKLLMMTSLCGLKNSSKSSIIFHLHVIYDSQKYFSGKFSDRNRPGAAILIFLI